MSCDHRGPALEQIDSLGQLGIALVRRDEERIVRREFARRLPHTFHRHELWRVGRQAMERDAVAIVAQPALAVLLELVTGRVVDDEEDLATVVTLNELPQELEERGPIEHVREPERELGGVERNRTEDVRGLARPVGVDARLNPDARPGAMQASVLPEAGFVLEDDNTTASRGSSADRGQAFGQPQLLGRLVGARQPLARPLDREVELMEQSGNVVIVVPDAEPPVNQVADPRARPDATRVTRRLRSGLDQPRELRVLRRAEPGRWTGGL